MARTAWEKKKFQCPSLQVIEALRDAFRIWDAHPTLCTLMYVLLAGTWLKHGSSWPVGHVLLPPGRGTNQMCYIGAWPEVQLRPASEFSVELRDGQGILNVGAFHCQQEGCLTCFLAGCLQLAFCPWHLRPPTTEEQGPLSVAHYFCTKNLSTSTVDLIGQFVDAPGPSAVHLFHVCTSEQIHQLGPKLHFFQHKVSLFHSSLSEATLTDEHLVELRLPFRQVELPLEIYRHLFVRAGGPASAFDVWLRGRSQEQ